MISLILILASFVLYKRNKEAYASACELIGFRIGFLCTLLGLVLWVARSVCHSLYAGHSAVLMWCEAIDKPPTPECLQALESSVAWQDLVTSIDYSLITLLIL